MIPKLRAWIKSKGRLECVRELIWHCEELTRVITSRKGVIYTNLTENAILMQSTGLFDKNGVEIFEWDVVRVCDEGNHKVMFIRGAFCIDFPDNGTPLLVYGENQLEVIGNIYENPELVEATS